MAVRSVIEVDVDPEGNFKAFYDLFKEYQSQLAKMPEDWQATSDAIDDAGTQMEDFAKVSDSSKDFLLIAATQSEIISKEIKKASASNIAFLQSLNKNVTAQKQFADESERGNKALEKMKKSADSVAHSIFGIGKFLMKLGVIGTGAAGLGGLLGAISLKDLAASSVDTQRGARGLGMTPGQLTAFRQDLGERYIDEGVLNTVADTQNSFIGQMWLSRASGISMGNIASQDPGMLSGQLALKAHDWWANTPESMRTLENLQSTGLPQAGFSLNAVKQNGMTPRSELERAIRQYKQDQSRFNISDRNTDAWYGFLRQIKDAGNTIETSLKKKLVALAPDLQHFIDVIGKDAMKLIDTVFTPKNLKSIEDGVDAFANYLGSGEFHQNMKDFADLVGDVAGSLRKVYHFLNIGGSDNDPAKTLDTAPGGGTAPSTAEVLLGKTRHFLNSPSREKSLEYLSQIEKKNGLEPGILAAMWKTESNEGSNLLGPMLASGDRAVGDFQFTSDTWKDWGKGGDRFSFVDEAEAAGRYVSSLSKHYGGDVKKALAAYNWGPRHLDNDITKNRAGWESRLPNETTKYLAKIASLLEKQGSGNHKVTISNNTSARVAVQANAAAAQ
ncbi:transglycosylase SLT domain-containing protein [Burkholderia anthina]|uniref:transglycosylase SLT domain-containing protein n=1 Tax=Burkholderia anthina TaxID=179879 RepID=UPI0015892835|nr:transglycosylase SLT domain-containing protein [Burkholderia anthina]